jgi:hypothetical protein
LPFKTEKHVSIPITQSRSNEFQGRGPATARRKTTKFRGGNGITAMPNVTDKTTYIQLLNCAKNHPAVIN